MFNDRSFLSFLVDPNLKAHRLLHFLCELNAQSQTFVDSFYYFHLTCNIQLIVFEGLLPKCLHCSSEGFQDLRTTNRPAHDQSFNIF